MSDWDKVEQLLGIVDKSRHWPTLKPVHDHAMKELEDIAKGFHQETDKKVAIDTKAKVDEAAAAEKKRQEEEKADEKIRLERAEIAKKQAAEEAIRKAAEDQAAADRIRGISRKTEDETKAKAEALKAQPAPGQEPPSYPKTFAAPPVPTMGEHDE